MTMAPWRPSGGILGETGDVDGLSVPEVPEPAKTLYERLGDEAAITQVVEIFYRRILADPLLAPLFAGTDMSHLQRHQTRFLMQVTGGPKQYSGRTIRAAHTGLNLRDDQFDAVAGHLAATLTEAGVAEADHVAVMKLVGCLRPEVVGH
jgi:hemoglobin